jgi:hypothetical protein
MVKIIWKKQAGYGETYIGFANDVRLFTMSYSLSKPRGDPNPYVLSSYLPGVEPVFGASRNELFVKAAELLNEWIKRIGIKAVLQ